MNSDDVLPFDIESEKNKHEALSSEALPLEEAVAYETNSLPTPEQALDETEQKKDNDIAAKSCSQQPANKRVLREHNKKELKTNLDNKTLMIESMSSIFWKAKNEVEQRCYEMLQKLKSHDSAALFLGNTISSKRQRAALNNLGSEKIDLSSVENKLKNHEYKTTNELATDIKKIWSSALKGSIKGSEIHSNATEMSNIFEAQFKGLENLRLDEMSEMDKKVDSLSNQIIDLHNIGGGARYVGSKHNKHSGEEKRATLDEKKTLHYNIQKLPPEHLRGVWEIIIEEVGNISNSKEVLEFNINALPVKVIRELENYVRSKSRSVKKKSKEKSHKKDKTRKESKGPKKDATDQDNKIQNLDIAELSNKRVHIQENTESGGQGFKQEEREKLKELSQKENDMTSESSFITDSDDE